MDTNKLPIGYWIKQADQLLTAGIDKIQSSLGLTRTDWQIVNSLAGQPSIDINKLSVLMEPFADPASISDTLSQLKDKELIAEKGNLLSLTETGKKQHALCLERQIEFRQNTMAGISGEDYQTTLMTLQKIVDNVKRNIIR